MGKGKERWVLFSIENEGEQMQTGPIYKSVPTMRDYEEYKKAEQYTHGWNDAMHFIFDNDEEMSSADVIERENVKNLIETAIEDGWELDYALERLKEI